MIAHRHSPAPGMFDGAAGGNVPPPRFRFGTRVLLPLALLLATASLLVGAAWRSLFPGVEVQVVPVVVKSVESRVGTSSITATGWIEPDPYPTYATALTSGVVSEVTVLEGDRVARGDVIAKLVDDDARITLAAAEADLSIAAGDLARARATLAAAAEHLETRITLRHRVAAARAAVAAAESSLAALDPQEMAHHAHRKSLEDELERKRPLVESGAVSAGEVRRLGYALDARLAEIAALRARRPVLSAQIDAVRADLSAAEEALARTIDERSAVDVARGEVTHAEGAYARAEAKRDQAQLALDRTVIHAVIDGVVMRRLIAPGSPVQVSGSGHGAHVAHLYDPARLQVRVDIPLADAAAVGLGQGAEISVSALPDQVFAGRVSRLVHEADLQKNTVEVKVAINAPSALLKPEMLARVRFLATSAGAGAAGATSTRERVLAPVAHLDGLSGDVASVWIATERTDDGAIADRRELRLGAATVTDDDGSMWREVVSGLVPGDWIIVSPPTDLAEGDAVSIHEGASDPKSGKRSEEP